MRRPGARTAHRHSARRDAAYGHRDGLHAYEVDGPAAVITLNRPEQLNAFTGTMLTELLAAFDQADADDAVRAIIVTGAGRAFCAGADLSAGGDTFDLDGAGGGDDRPTERPGPARRRRDPRDAAHLRRPPSR